MRTTLVSLLATACIMPVAAQHNIPPVLQIYRETVKEGRTSAHEKVEADFARAFRKIKAAPYSIALTSMSGLPEAWFVAHYSSFAALETAQHEMDKPPFKNELDLLDARDGELRASSRSLLAIFRPDLSYHPESAMTSKMRYVAIGSFRVRIGHEAELTEGAAILFKARDKTSYNSPTLCYQVIAGAPNGLYLFFDALESLKAWDEMPAQQKALMEAMGRENFQKFMQGAGTLFSSMETNLFAVNPRMSYVPKEIEDADPAFWKPKPIPAPAKATTN